MELDDWILQDIRHVDLTTATQNFRMLEHHKPAHVGEEESTVGIVRIGIRLRVLVVDPMVTNPVVKSILNTS